MTPLVPRGAPIAVVAPCGAYDPDRFERGLQIARAYGHDLRPLPDLLRPHRYLAADDDQRATQLAEALTSPDYAAVWIARGGYGLTRIVHRLPWSELPPRPVLGFSDVTVLLSALHAAGAGPAIHAPVIHSLPITDEPSLAHLFALLEGRAPAPMAGDPWIPGRAEGWLCGGNLCLLAAACGTPWQLDARGAILVIEEIVEAPYKIDRMLQQLRSSGVLDGVAGVAVGELVGCDPPPDAGYSLAEIVVEHLAPLGIPVLGGVPVGHGAHNHAFVWGAPAVLDGATLTWTPRASA